MPRKPTSRLVLASLTIALALPAGAGAAERVASAGPLRAQIERDPWRLELVDRRGRTVLAEHPGTGGGPTGTLGFETATGWEHATRVLSSRREDGAFLAELETTDPLRTISLEIRRAGAGVIALEAVVEGPSVADLKAVGAGFVASRSERYLGFGERSNAVDQRGGVVENYVTDGPYQSEEQPFLNGFVPPWGLRDRPEATYYPVPWLLSTSGYGVLVDNPETSYFRLGSEDADAWSVEVVKAPEGLPGGELAPPPDRLALRFFAGPRPAGALRRFTAQTGRQPRPVAPWTLGSWYQSTGGPEIERVEALREADAPVSVLQTYLHYLPCGSQQGSEDEQPPRTAAAHDAGVAITTYFNPMVCTDYQPAYGEAASADALTRTQAGEPFVYRYGASPDDVFVVSQYDFFKEAGREAYATRLDEAIGDGYDGWMEDFGEYTPLNSLSGEEDVDGTRAHNPYATRYHCAAFNATRDGPRPIARYQRSGWTGAARCADVVWGGDPTTSWDFDGLASAVKQSLSIGASGVGIWGSDIGGFFALGFNKLSPELLTRWVQFGAVSPVMRTQANGVALPPKDRPQVDDPDQIGNWRRYTKLHTQLYPYLTAAVEAYRRSGLPLMRHLALANPGDRRAAGVEDQLLLGPDLLAAPVIEPDSRERELYLPRGRWVDLWRSANYVKRSGGLRLQGAKTLRGSREVTLPAPLRQLPLLVRAGAVLPMLPPGVDTLARYGRSEPGITTLGERRRSLRLLAFPRGRSSAGFHRRGRLRSRERDGAWKLSLRSGGVRRFRIQAALATLRDPFEPCAVEIDGRRLSERRWSYSRRKQVLRARFGGRNPVLRVEGCER